MGEGEVRRRSGEGGDALATARRLLGSALRVGVDRLRGGEADGVPRTVDDVTPGWLEGALRVADPTVRVHGVRPLDGHSGTTTRARLAVTYAQPCALPETFFLKITPRGVAQRIFGHAFGLGETEVRFYRELARALPVRAPRAYAARASRDAARFVLLLEDLSPPGARFVEIGGQVEAGEAHTVARTLAALHAPFWESPRFQGDLSWVRSLEGRRAELPYERFLSARMVERARRRYGSGASGAFHGAARLVCESRDALEARWAAGRRTLVHGDCHIGNLFFEGDDVGLLDWQVLARAPGLRDLAYFLCNSLPVALREREEATLVGAYLAGLRAAGVDAPSDEEAWEQYRAFALYCWLAAAFTAGAGGLQAEPIARAGLDRATRAVESLGSLELFA